MVQNLNPNEIYQFIVSDFRGAWDSIAANYNQIIGRGNFMFALQVMNLLKFASRLCANDSKLLNNFSAVTIRKGLVVFQFTISICLVLGAIVIVRQMNFLDNQQLKPSNIVVY